MPVATIDAYGAPAYGPLKGIEGIVGHTPENAGPTLADAIAIAKWQATDANTSGGSYHGILGHDSSKFSDAVASCAMSAHWTMVRSVPWNQAAGGLSTRRDAIWAPGRYPWLQSLLSPAAYADPNGYLQQISLSGKAAWYTQYGYPKGALVALAEWIIVLEGAYKFDAVLSLHRHWQTNRTDPGPLDLWDKVLVEYAKLKSGSEATDTLQEQIDTLTAQLTAQKAANTKLTNRITGKNTKFTSGIAKVKAGIVDLNAAIVDLEAGKAL